MKQIPFSSYNLRDRWYHRTPEDTLITGLDKAKYAGALEGAD